METIELAGTLAFNPADEVVEIKAKTPSNWEFTLHVDYEENGETKNKMLNVVAESIHVGIRPFVLEGIPCVLNLDSDGHVRSSTYIDHSFDFLDIGYNRLKYNHKEFRIPNLVYDSCTENNGVISCLYKNLKEKYSLLHLRNGTETNRPEIVSVEHIYKLQRKV